MRIWDIRVLLLILTTLSVVGCGSGTKISETDFGSQWPFTVSKGKLNCEGSSGMGAVTFTANGITYAVNGTAKAVAKKRNTGWRDIDEIWKASPDIPGAKVSMGPIIEKGRSLCK